MINPKIKQEVTFLRQEDLFAVVYYKPADFDYPLHIHTDFELNLVLNTSGKRIIGDSIEDFKDIDLILTGPNLPHLWKAPSTDETTVITIYFHDLIVNSFLMNKKMFAHIKDMLIRSNSGISFSEEIKHKIKDRLLLLSKSKGFNTGLEFFSILNDLATSEKQRALTSITYYSGDVNSDLKSRRVAAICKYIENFYKSEITLKEVAEKSNMSESAFSHLFKKCTTRNFITYLNEVRVSQATKMLFETSLSISEICYNCGFNNLSNFNRVFLKYLKQTPSQYRESLKEILNRF